jgi:hypothetical protein
MYHPHSHSSAVVETDADTEFVGGAADGRRVKWSGAFMVYLDPTLRPGYPTPTDVESRKTYYVLTDDRTSDGLMIARPASEFESNPALLPA